MRALIQRVKSAQVTVENEVVGAISRGFLIFVGAHDDDTEEDIIWLANKISKLRIMDDDSGKMNLSISEIDGEMLVVSQFTLFAKTKKGNRPSFINAAKPEKALEFYNKFISQLQSLTKQKVQQGNFGAMMDVELINDGPVTIWIDTQSKE